MYRLTEFARIAIICAQLRNKIVLQDSNSITEKCDRDTDDQNEKHQNCQKFQSHICEKGS